MARPEWLPPRIGMHGTIPRTVRLREETWFRLEEMAEEWEISRSLLLRLIIERFLETETPQVLPTAPETGEPHDSPGKPGETDTGDLSGSPDAGGGDG